MESNDLVTGAVQHCLSPKSCFSRACMGVYQLNPVPSGSILHFQTLDIEINLNIFGGISCESSLLIC